MSNNLWTDDEIVRLKKYYQFCGPVFCSKILQRSYYGVRDKAKEFGLKVRKDSRIALLRVGRDKSTFEDGMINLTPESCYMWGLLWADGWKTNRPGTTSRVVGLSIDAEDMGEIEWLLKDFGGWSVRCVPGYLRRRPAGDHVYHRALKTAYLCSRRMGNLWDQMGYSKRASGYSPLFNLMTPELSSFWLRGFSDGDGCWYSKGSDRAWTAAGPGDQDWHFLTKILDSIGVYYKITRKPGRKPSHKGTSTVVVSGIDNLIRLGSFMYRDRAEIGFPRKFNIFLMIKAEEGLARGRKRVLNTIPGEFQCVAVSDLHMTPLSSILKNYTGDFLFIGGDHTYLGRDEEMEFFRAELLKVRPQFRHCIIINGNHEKGWEFQPEKSRKLAKDTKSIYLENEGVQIDGVSVWGSPATPFFYSWAYNFRRGKDIASIWSKIPDNLDILLTHGPPYGILDSINPVYPDPLGCMDLLQAIEEKRPRIHLFGHIHQIANSSKYTRAGATDFYNIAIMDEDYKPRHPVTVFTLYKSLTISKKI
jgi:Icc-related predicted phosphoesterase